MLVGLQGSGKTTTAAKIALRLKTRERKKVLMASLDVQRPAAQEQLAQLGRQVGVATLPIVAGERPVAITRRALDTGRREVYVRPFPAAEVPGSARRCSHRPSRSDGAKLACLFSRGGRSSVGRAPGCGPGGRGFESPRSPCVMSRDMCLRSVAS